MAEERVVCTIVPKKLVKYITKTLKDKEDRFVALQFHLGGKNYTIVNIYAPTQEKTIEQLEYLKILEQMLDEFPESNLVIGGTIT